MTGPILFCLACRTKAAAGFQKAVARLLARREKELRQAYVVSVHGQKLEEPESWRQPRPERRPNAQRPLSIASS